MVRSLALFLLTIALGTTATLLLRERSGQERVQRQLAMANEENARLRKIVEQGQREKKLERTRELRAQIEKEVAQIRKLSFKHPVEYAYVSRSEIKAIFSKALAEESTDAEIAAVGRAWHRLGLLPKPIDLRETLLDLLSEQVAAFFDQKTHKLYMFEDSSLESANDQVILAHELTHALQDQHFGIKNLPLEIKENDDRALAALALLEGDATQVMTVYMSRHVSMRTVLDSATSLLTQQMEQLQKVPRFLRDRLIFPYVQGRVFVAAVQGSRASLDELYRKPPSSTSQILHPGKYTAASPEEPLPIAWAETSFHGRTPSLDNVVGEAGVKALLLEWTDEATARKASGGWRGDRFLSFDAGDSLAWSSVWVDEAHARQFFEAEQRGLTKRYGGQAIMEGEDACEIHGAGRVVRLTCDRTTQRVSVFDGATAEDARHLQEQFGK